MPSRRVSCQQQSPCSSVESPPSDSNSLCLAPERYFGIVDVPGSQCSQEIDTMPSKMAASEQPSCSSVESPPSDSNSSSRYHRNLAEKQRRDKLNGFITELATLVPMVSMTTRRLDKTSILRLSAAYLRIYQSKLNPRKCKKFSWGPNILNSDHLNEILQVSGGFLLIASFPEKIIYASPNVENILGQQNERFLGKIIYVSSNVEKILGQQNIDMIGQSLFHFVHPDDVKYVHDKLKSLAQSPNHKPSLSSRSVFCARMKERNMPRSETVNYQMMHFSCTQDIEDNEQLLDRKASSARRGKSSGMEPKSDIFITAFIKPVNANPLNELSITEAFQEEYVTRHGIDGKILFADHRISTITGHLPHEVHGMSAYEYIFEKDIPIAILAQRRMFSSSDGTGMIVYRLRTATQTAVYLKTIGHLQYDKSSAKVHQFICINKLLSEEDGEKELQKFIEHYTPHISGASSPPTLHAILPCVNPVEVPRLLDTTFSSEVRSPLSQPISTPSDCSSQREALSCSPYSIPETCSTVDSMVPPRLHGNSHNGDLEVTSSSPSSLGSGVAAAAHSPNRLFDLDASNYAPSVQNAQPCERDDILHDEGNFSNGYYAFAAAFCSKIPSEQSLSTPHSRDPTENGAKRLRYVSKRKRSLETVFSSPHSLETNCAAELAKSKYTKFSTESCDNLSRGGNIQTIGTTGKNCQSSLNENFSCKRMLGREHIRINNLLKDDFSATGQKDIYRAEVHDYLHSPEGDVMDHYKSGDSVSETHLSSSPAANSAEGAISASPNSRKVDMGWRLNGDYISPCLGRMNHVQTSHFNGCVLPNLECQNGVNSDIQNFIVDQAEEWLNDSFSGFNPVNTKY